MDARHAFLLALRKALGGTLAVLKQGVWGFLETLGEALGTLWKLYGTLWGLLGTSGGFFGTFG